MEMMLRIEENCRRGLTRRALLEAGGLGLLGLSLPNLFQAQAAAAPAQRGSLGRARNILFLFLSGGPSQFETFDPKPDAPAEIRGGFRPIATRVPGVHFCELLPRTAAIADRLAVVRSMSTNDPNHESGGYWVNTGYQYTGPNMRATHPSDWPTIGTVVKMLKPSPRIPFSAVMLPEPIIANPGIFLPGQNAGFLGRRWDPEIFRCDPSAANFKVEGMAEPPDVPTLRLSSRMSLLEQLDRGDARPRLEAQEQDRYRKEAARVLLSGPARTAFEIGRESPATRDRYGRNKWGQSLILARRLIEAGVRMVFVNWPRDPGDLESASPLWDTHANNDRRMKDVLCPQFDLGYTALIEDLSQRGLLSETLVVAIGEMGRTPRYNAAGGRDHWGNVFSFVMAGAGIKAGQAYGRSDAKGSDPIDGRVQPSDLSATIFHLLGIGHDAQFRDRLNRPYHVSQGQPIAALL
jgi:hypothetical protein